MRALRSLRPSWILVLRMVVAYSLSCAYFVFEAVAVMPAWVLQTRHVLRHVAVGTLSLPLRVPNVALYGTIASLGLGLPDVLSRFRLRQVRWLSLALNRQHALASETA